MPDQLELFAETLVETGEKGLAVLRSAKLVSVEPTVADAAASAAAHAGENFGDGDYKVTDRDGRTVAKIAVRFGVAAVTPVVGAPTAAEELASLYEPCPFCSARMVLIPCGACKSRRCARCLGRRVCCNPNNEPPVFL